MLRRRIDETNRALAAGALGLLACGAPDPEPGLSLALNWKPEPEFGGIFEAERIGALAKRDLAVERTGGPGAPVVQMVTARQVSFGIASADEVVLARDRGSDVVAIFATYQTCPQGLMTHAARELGSLEALFAASGTLAVEPGLPVREVPGEALRLRLAPGGAVLVQHRPVPRAIRC